MALQITISYPFSIVLYGFSVRPTKKKFYVWQRKEDLTLFAMYLYSTLGTKKEHTANAGKFAIVVEKCLQAENIHSLTILHNVKIQIGSEKLGKYGKH